MDLIATDYFTKWVEAKPVKFTTSQEIITFIEEQIIQREMLDMAEAFKFKLLQSTPYYAQTNGQAEFSNKDFKERTYGHDAILPVEIGVQYRRIAHQHSLIGEDYSQAMLLELEGLDASRIDTLNKLLAGK
ncbi:unnamed protein product [Prunus armeniaca]